MWAVWVVVGVLGASAMAAAVAARRSGADVEPTVREFADFRDALSQQVAGVHAESRFTRRHVDRQVGEGHRRG